MDSLKDRRHALKVKELIDSSFHARFDEGRGMQAASAAVLLAENQDIPSDLKAAAWTQFGNALRFSGKFRQAEAALEKAFKLLSDDSDLHTRANLLEISASLYRECGRLVEAEACCLAEAIEIQRRLGQWAAVARDLILCGICCKDARQYSRSLNYHSEALKLLDESSDIVLYVSACHGLIDSLVAAGRIQVAINAFALVEPVFNLVSEVQLIGRITWLRGRICLSAGDRGRAIEAYREAKRLLNDLGDAELEALESELAAAEA